LGVVLPLAVQYAKEAWRVPIVGITALLTAILTGFLSPIIMAAQVPQLAWDLFMRLAAGYTAAKIPSSALGSAPARKVLGTGVAVVLLAGTFLAVRAFAQDLDQPQGDGGLRDFVVVIVTGLVARGMSWLAKKIKGRPHTEDLLT